MTLGVAIPEVLPVILDKVIILEVLVVVLMGKEVVAGAEAGVEVEVNLEALYVVIAIVIVAGAQGMFWFACKVKIKMMNHEKLKWHNILFCSFSPRLKHSRRSPSISEQSQSKSLSRFAEFPYHYYLIFLS